MWDLKLLLLNFLFYFNFWIIQLFSYICDLLNPFLFKGIFFSNLKYFYAFAFNTSIFFGIKFLISIGFLILIRGGTPRYRYDFLTKLGWLRFIGLVIFVFLFSILIFFIF